MHDDASKAAIMPASRKSCRTSSGDALRGSSYPPRDNVPHELGRQLGLLVGVFDVDGLAVHDGQLMAELVADVAVVADLAAWRGRSRGSSGSCPRPPRRRSARSRGSSRRAVARTRRRSGRAPGAGRRLARASRMPAGDSVGHQGSVEAGLQSGASPPRGPSAADRGGRR